MEFLRRRLSDGNFLAGGGADFGGPPRTPPTSAPLLLVVGRPHTDWVKLFRGKSVHGDVELRVEQAQFSELSCLASSHGALSVTIEPQRGAVRRVRPDFVLLREEPGGGPGGSARRFLMGLHLGGVPASTPLQAAVRAAHPPAMLAQAVQLQKELGSEGFPVAPLRFCHRPRALLTAPTFPMLVTLSPAPGGVDTVRVSSPEALGAVAGAMAGVRAGALVQQEPPREGRFRLRVQRIGAEIRAMRAPLADPEQMEAVTLSPRHRDWLSVCSRLLGGAEICGLEAEVEADGSERITRVMGSWLPLSGPEDHARVVEVVLGRMRAELGPPRGPTRPRPQMPAIAGTPPQQRPPPQGAPPSAPSQPRPPGGVASTSPRPPQPRGPAQPRPQAPPTSPQPRPPGPQPRPHVPTVGQQRPQAPPTAQPRPQTPPIGQPRGQAPPTGAQAPPTAAQPRPQGQPRPQTPPIGQLRPQTPPPGAQAPPTAHPRPQTPPTSPQPRPQPTPIGQPRSQAPPTSPQPRPQAPPTSPQPRPSGPQPRPQAPPIGQPRPQAPPTSPQPRPQAPLTSPQPRQATPTSPQPRPQTPPIGQPRPQTPPTSPQPRHSGPQPRPPGPQPRPPGPQATPTMRQPRPQAPPPGPKPALAPKPGSPAPPPPDAARSLRQSLASFFE